jgi:hypothetical protein
MTPLLKGMDIIKVHSDAAAVDAVNLTIDLLGHFKK